MQQVIEVGLRCHAAACYPGQDVARAERELCRVSSLCTARALLEQVDSHPGRAKADTTQI